MIWEIPLPILCAVLSQSKPSESDYEKTFSLSIYKQILVVFLSLSTPDAFIFDISHIVSF